MAMTTMIELKREQLQTFIRRVLEPEPAVKAVVGIGSIATGQMGPDSDIDAAVFFEPMDWYIIPAEFIWRPSDGTYHSIFTTDVWVKEEGIALDCRRLDLRQWSDPTFDWPEGHKAELSEGWIAFDRNGVGSRLIEQRTRYPDALQQVRLDEAIIWLDQHLSGEGPEDRWQLLGPIIAHDRLQAAYDYLVRALFAYNRRWLPWRNRRMDSLLQLPWLPDGFAQCVLSAVNAPSLEYEGYIARAEVLRSLFDALLARLVEDGLYSSTPIDQAFIRSNDQPGFAWNMSDWNGENLRRVLAAVSDASDINDKQMAYE